MVKSTVQENSVRPKRVYPYIGSANNNGDVVLFTAPCTGVQLKPGIYSTIGHHSTGWAEGNFEPLNGKVILENE